MMVRLWHLCSLDAATAATCWTAFIAYVSRVDLLPTTLASMFLAVWIIYAGDRLLDALRPGAVSGDLQERHMFHLRHRKVFLFTICTAAILLAALVGRIPHAALRLFAALGTLLVAYCLFIHLRDAADRSSRLPKEFLVGAFFASAVFIPTVARAPELRVALLPSAILLGVVCALNCFFIYAWEHEGGAMQAHWTTRLAARHIHAAGLLVLLLAVLVFYWRPSGASYRPAMALACGSSAACFLALHAVRKHLDKLDLRALIDLALVIPLAFSFLRCAAYR